MPVQVCDLPHSGHFNIPIAAIRLRVAIAETPPFIVSPAAGQFKPAALGDPLRGFAT
ncbi:MAG TPA: hypothetical protein VHC04_03535 [Rhodopila sp.]|jgi:hypothetical protein|nr:hypothetical protein [Rhodopila sp.]